MKSILYLALLFVLFNNSYSKELQIGEKVKISKNYLSKCRLLILNYNIQEFKENELLNMIAKKAGTLNLFITFFNSNQSDSLPGIFSSDNIELISDENQVYSNIYSQNNEHTLIITDENGIILYILKNIPNKFDIQIYSTILNLIEKENAKDKSVKDNLKYIQEIKVSSYLTKNENDYYIRVVRYLEKENKYIIIDNLCNYLIVDSLGNIEKKYTLFNNDKNKFLYKFIRKENLFIDRFYFSELIAPSDVEIQMYNLENDSISILYKGERDDNFNPKSDFIALSDSEFIVGSRVSYVNLDSTNHLYQIINLNDTLIKYFGKHDIIYKNKPLVHFFDLYYTIGKNNYLYSYINFSDSLYIYNLKTNSVISKAISFDTNYFCKDCKTRLINCNDETDKVAIKKIGSELTPIASNRILIDEMANNIYYFYYYKDRLIQPSKLKLIFEEINKKISTIVFSRRVLPFYINNSILSLCTIENNQLYIKKTQLIGEGK